MTMTLDLEIKRLEARRDALREQLKKQPGDTLHEIRWRIAVAVAEIDVLRAAQEAGDE